MFHQIDKIMKNIFKKIIVGIVTWQAKIVIKKYNVILMDVKMPEMDGLETTLAIRRMKVNQPFIIAITANVMSTDREECLKAGMNDYITKPICVDEVMNKLKIAAGYCSTNK